MLALENRAIILFAVLPDRKSWSRSTEFLQLVE